MRFLLDENVHAASTKALRDQGHEVLHVVDSPLRARPDEHLIEFCNQDNRVFVTRDIAVARHAALLRTGLILIRTPQEFVSRNIPALLANFTATATEVDVSGRLVVISPGQVRSRELSTLL
jgi:predicted nuclease of predicted toxin-antitoxin system